MTECYDTDPAPTPFLRRPFVSQWLLEWLLEWLLGAFIRQSALRLRLPDGTTRRFGQGFRHNGLAVFQLQLVHRVDALPLTRAYIAANESALETMPQITVDHGDPTRGEPTEQAAGPSELARRG